jgi:hypothetical protein
MIKSRGLRWLEHVACMWEIISACNILARKPKGKGHFGVRHRLKDDIKMDLKDRV